MSDKPKRTIIRLRKGATGARIINPIVYAAESTDRSFVDSEASDTVVSGLKWYDIRRRMKSSSKWFWKSIVPIVVTVAGGIILYMLLSGGQQSQIHPEIRVDSEVKLEDRRLIFGFKNIGSARAEDVRVSSYGIGRRSKDLDDYHAWAMGRTKSGHQGKLYGVLSPGRHVAGILTLLTTEAKSFDNNTIHVLQIDYTYQGKEKRFFTFYGHTTLNGKNRINLQRQIENEL